MRHWCLSLCMGDVWSAGWISIQPADQTPPIQSDKYQCLIDKVIFSWWWAHRCPKHVEKRNKYVKQNCALGLTYLQDYRGMHGQWNIKFVEGYFGCRLAYTWEGFTLCHYVFFITSLHNQRKLMRTYICPLPLPLACFLYIYIFSKNHKKIDKLNNIKPRQAHTHKLQEGLNMSIIWHGIHTVGRLNKNQVEIHQLPKKIFSTDKIQISIEIYKIFWKTVWFGVWRNTTKDNL